MFLRLKYKKTKEGRFLSHLDMMRTMERAFRRARLPLAFSEGFNPHPKVSFGSALAVGVTSDGEYLDIELRREMPAKEALERLESVMPPGLTALEIKELQTRARSLAAIINLARYRVRITTEPPLTGVGLAGIIKEALEKPEYLLTRPSKNGPRQVDVRKGIYSLEGETDDNGRITLLMDVLTGSQGNTKPEDVVRMLEDVGGFKTSTLPVIHRVGLFVLAEGRIVSPLEFE